MEDYLRDETRKMSHVVLVITVTLFSIVLIVLNVSQGWERWTIPVLCAVIFAVFVMHIGGKPGERERVYIYTVMLCMEIFYYAVKIDLVYNVAPISMLIIMLIALTKERRLVWSCVFAGCAGLVLRMINSNALSRILWHVVIIVLAGFIITRFLGEIKRIEDYFKEFIKRLRQQNKSADDFLANVSHEIRTPVNAVIGLTGVCLEKEENSEIKGNLKMVSEAGHRLSEQISDILDYSEIEREALAVNVEDYRISMVLKDVVEELKVFSNPDVEFILDVEPAVPSVMRTDILKLKRILWHVISNGFKYTARGSVYVHISTTKQDYGVNLRIDVWDTGVGMTETEREKIYEHFYQSDSGRNRTSSGLGLGMSIAKGFTDALEGFISVSSATGYGTRVRICIPQGVSNDSPCMSVKNSQDKIIGGFINLEKFSNPIVREGYNRMVTHAVKGLNVTMHRVDNIAHLKVLREGLKMTHLFVGEDEYLENKAYMDRISEEMILIVICGNDFEPDRNSRVKVLRKPFSAFQAVELLNADVYSLDAGESQLFCEGVRILVVDDEPMNLMVAENILKRYGIDVTKASSGVEAVDYCMRNSYDVIFMDYMMPKMDGIETARKIRSIRSDGSAPKMVAFTANAVSTAKEIFINEGFSAFLGKPIELNELERVLKSVLPESVFTYRNYTDGTEEAETEKDDFTLLTEKGIDTKKGMDYCLKDREMYISVLVEFYRDAENKIKDMEEFYDAENWEEFVIRVHSVKSSSLMIGAEALSKKARLIEEATKDRNIEYVRDMYPAFLPDYRSIVGIIGELYGDTQV